MKYYYDTKVSMMYDYYPFGSLMPNRSFSSSDYRYGFNGQEKDDEIKGSGNSLDFGERIYDPRLGRFLSVDKLTGSYPWWSPYAFAGNTPIQAIDLDGLEIYYAQSGQVIGTYGTSTEIRVLNENQVATATTEFAAYTNALKTDPAATNTYLGSGAVTGSVAFADYFTAVSDVIDGTLVNYIKNVRNCNACARKQVTDAGVTLSGGAINTIVDATKDPLLSADPIGGAIYIQTQLNKGDPVMIGLQETAAGSTTPQDPGNTNSATGHFVVAVGTNVSSTGDKSFRYYDNATSANGKNAGNELKLNKTTGVAEDTTPANTNKGNYKVSEVRKNQ